MGNEKYVNEMYRRALKLADMLHKQLAGREAHKIACAEALGENEDEEAPQENAGEVARDEAEAAVRNEAEQELAELKDCYDAFMGSYLDFRELSDHLYDAIHIADGEGKVLFVNQAYTRTTGILPEQILGRYVKDIEEEGKLYKGSVTQAVIEKRERVNSIAWVYPLDKEVLLTGSPVFDENGELKFVVTNTRDFSGLKELEKKLARLTAVSEKDKEELAYLRKQQMSRRRIIYRSESMKAVLELVNTVAATDVTVLITGESGTGKELIADEIYYSSARRDKPFIKVNCAAIPSELLESELFGYEAGAFTDASRKGKIGMFELANGGVILLDEIGDMPLSLQTKLLRVLQQKEIMRIGGSRVIPLDIRIIASTNRDLQREIRSGRFREDLFYRLNVVPVLVKPLRERKEDIPCLAQEFLQVYARKYGKGTSFDKDVMEVFQSYDWPGNIRELENLVERLVVTDTRGIITASAVMPALNMIPGETISGDDGARRLKDYVAEYEKRIICDALRKWGSKRKAARALGIDHSTLVKKCQSYGLNKDQDSGE